MDETGFVGTGTIGGPMALRLIEQGWRLRVFDRDPQASAAACAAGATRAASVAELARDCPTVLLSLPGPAQIEAVVADADGLLAHADALSTIVDLSTNALALNRRLAAQAAAAGVNYLDAPVSGGRQAARAGGLAVMVGGDAAAFEQVRPLLAALATNLFHLGPAGAGTLAKLVNNQVFLCASVLVQEAFVLGARAGMAPTDLLAVLKASSAGPVVARAPLTLSRNFDAGIFALDIAAKDIALALEAAAALDVPTPLTTAAHGVYQQALAQGLGSADFQATIKVLEAAAGITLPALRRPEKPA
ncbi:MAG: NAD(P)-dependent oxidoreductase [Gammaproteobacteria bacterium]